MRGAESSDVFFFDEFDSYDIKQKCSIEWMICMLVHPKIQKSNRGKCVILASATAEDEMVERLRNAGVAVFDDFNEDVFDDPSDDMRQIMPRVHLTTVSQGDYRGLTRVSQELEQGKLRSWIKERYAAINKSKYGGKTKWMAIICDSVMDCRETADE